MAAPVNPFKAALRDGVPQIGLWVSFGSPNVAEMLSHCGYDWLVIDGEHSPNDLPLMLSQLQAAAAGGTHCVVRVPVGEAWMIKQVLDIGAQTVLVPMVESADQARDLVRAMRYPPEGVRGMGMLGRGACYGMTADYATTANDQVCLLVQVESRAGLAAIEDICAVEGVDGVFIGPADLSADMGYPGNSAAPEVRQAIAQGLQRIRAAGRAPGILVGGAAAGQEALGHGAVFVAIGHDVGLLLDGALALRAQMI